MLESFRIDKEWISNFLDCFAIPEPDPLGPYKKSVLQATGMTTDELDSFLDARGIRHSRTRISAQAIDELKEWYVGKMRRYVRNAVALKLEAGSDEDILFHEFCSKYHKSGHRDIRTWDDIDETKLLLDFEAACWGLYLPILPADHKGDLLNRIQRCYLFHLILKPTTKHCLYQFKTILSIILCNRYHIFTAEADLNADTTDHKAYLPYKSKFNLPWSASRHVFASLAKAKTI